MILSAAQMLLLIEREIDKKNGKPVEPVPTEVFEFLKRDLIEASLDAQESGHAGLEACNAQAPGYLKIAVRDSQIYVPWHLVDAFPNEMTVERLLDIGHEIALSDSSGLCISGSAAWTGLDIEIGDLDFSQYTAKNGKQICDQLEELKKPTSTRVLIKAAYGADCCDYLPWERWHDVVDSLGACESASESKRVMLDYIVRSESYGALPASAAIFISDFVDRDVGSAKESFVFQEIVSAPLDTDAPPWTLVDPNQIGAYLYFLFGQIAKFKEEKPIKAIKRALSLSYLLALDESIDRAVVLLESKQSCLAVRLKRQSEVEEIVELLRTNCVYGWDSLEPVDTSKKEGTGLGDVVSDFDSFFRSLADNLRAEDAGGRWPTF